MNDSIGKHNDKNSERIYFPELDGLRFFAFILVFIYHNNIFSDIPFLFTFFNNGWIGVDLFFVLSAFLFTKLLMAEYEKTKTISFIKFYLRRIFRIWPIYFIFIAFSIVLFTLVQKETIDNYIGIRIIGLFTFSDNIFSAMKELNPLPFSKHLWTIGYEEQFYIFIPIIIFLLVRSSFKIKIFSLISVLILFNVIRIILISNKHFIAISVLPVSRFESIIMGIIIGFGGIDFLLKRINPLIWGLLGILFFILLCLLPDQSNSSYWIIFTYTLIGISTSLVLYSALYSKYIKEIFSKKIFVFLGKRSYGLYVYHLFGNGLACYAIIHFPKIPSNPIAVFIYSLSFTILTSILSYQFIEKPFLILKKKFEIITSRPV